MKFSSSDIFVAEGLIYRVRSQWLGKGIFLKSEVPSDRAVPAHVIQEKWRQCSECSDAWEEESNEEFSHCPSCGVLVNWSYCLIVQYGNTFEVDPESSRFWSSLPA